MALNFVVQCDNDNKVYSDSDSDSDSSDLTGECVRNQVLNGARC